ncbi:MAG: hypothetical protein Q8P41_21615 [Pseudomonadota bacterium]|nr:hypothetical protein [Pseudomonadota bacterium]
MLLASPAAHAQDGADVARDADDAAPKSTGARGEAPAACKDPLELAHPRVVLAVEAAPERATAVFVVKGDLPSAVAGRVLWARRGDTDVPLPASIGELTLDRALHALTLALPASQMRGGEWTFGVGLTRTLEKGGCPEDPTLELRVSVPAPALSIVPSAAAWDVVVPSWEGFAQWTGLGPQQRVLHVKETGGAAGLRDLDATWVPLGDKGGGSATVDIACAPRADQDSRPPVGTGPAASANASSSPAASTRLYGASASAAPVRPGDPLPTSLLGGGLRTLDCAVSNFGLGTLGAQTGTLRLDAPSLATPTDVAVTVTTRLSRVSIPLLILAGIGISWLLRDRLNKRVASLEAKDRAERALGRARLVREASADAPFRTAVDAAVTRFGADLADAQDADAVTALVTTFDTKVKDAETDLQTRTEAANTDLKSLEQVLLATWHLPPEVAATVEAARTAARAARPALDARNATVARQSIDLATSALGRLKGVIAGFLATAKPLLDAPLAQVAPLVATLREKQAVLEGDSADPIARLEALHVAWEPIDRSLGEALVAARAELLAALETSLTEYDDAKDLAPRRDALKGSAVPVTFQARVTLHAALKQDAAALLVVLHAIVAGRNVGSADLDSSFASGDWRRAVALAGGKNQAGLGGEGTPADAGTGPRIATVPVSLPPTATVPPLAPWSPVWGGLADGRGTRQALEQARSATFWVSAIVITVLGTSQFSAEWVGTFDEVTSAFAWGLGLDVTSAFVFGLATQLRTKAGKDYPGTGAAETAA